MAPPTGNTVEFESTNKGNSNKDGTTISTFNRSRSSWLDYYATTPSSDPNRGAIWDARYNKLDPDCIAFVGNEAEFLNTILSNHGYNCALIPSHNKGFVQSVHNCFVYEDEAGKHSVVGVKGTYFNSPWKVIPVKDSFIPLKMANTREFR